MKKDITFLSIIIVVFFICSLANAASWDEIKRGVENAARGSSSPGRGLSNDEVIRGLKEALSIGAKNAALAASKINGYYGNLKIRIPFPPDAQKVKSVAESLGMKKQVDDFVRTLNRAAEEAAKEAVPIFVDAIKQMTIQDGFRILKGPDDAATQYLRQKTTAPLTAKFRPVVHRALQKVEITRYWNPIITRYNQVPFVTKANPDLDAYVTEKGLQGLFYLIAKEEKKIRENPAARVTELLRRVFGS
jgi:RNA binding exosome subunit